MLDEYSYSLKVMSIHARKSYSVHYRNINFSRGSFFAPENFRVDFWHDSKTFRAKKKMFP